MSAVPSAPGEGSRAILDALPDAVFLVDGGVIVDANEAAAQAFGANAELVGAPIVELLRDGEWARLEQMEAQRAGGLPVPRSCRLRFTRRDGASSLMADVRWRARGGSRLVITARDVTDLSRAEAVMGRLAHLPSTMDGAGALLDASELVFSTLGWRVAFTALVPGGSVTHRMIAPPNDPVGDYGRTLVGRFTPLEETPILAEIVRTGAPLFLENLPSASAGAVRAAVALSDSMQRGGTAPSAWCPIRVDGKVTHVLAVTGTDLTGHDFVAIQLFSAQLAAAMHLQALRLEMVHRERLAAVGEMAAVLAHEVRNPLGVMFTALGTLGHVEPGRSDQWRPLLGILLEEAERLQRLVTDLLEFSSSSTAVVEAVALRPIVESALLAAQYDAAFVASQPIVDVNVAEALLVQTDRVLFRRVLVNILVNAFQHVTRGGRVAISATTTQAAVAVRIFNDGLPIRPEVASRVFEPFFTTQPRGTGLGLAIVRRVCVDVGARVDVEAHPAGATFRIELPGNDA